MLGELVAHGVIFLLMLFLYVTSMSFPILNIGGKLGAAWWPQVVLGTGMVLILLSVFFIVRKNQKGLSGKSKKITKKEMVGLLTSTAIFVFALLMLRSIGFLFVCPIIVFGFMYQLGARKPLGLILVPIISALVFTVLFGHFMEVSLPRGMGLFRSLTYYLY